MIDDTNQKYLGAIDIDGGLAWCEVATGKVYVDQVALNREKIVSEKTLDTILSKFNIVEMLFNEDINKANLLRNLGTKKILLKPLCILKTHLKDSCPTRHGNGILAKRKIS